MGAAFVQLHHLGVADTADLACFFSSKADVFDHLSDVEVVSVTAAESSAAKGAPFAQLRRGST